MFILWPYKATVVVSVRPSVRLAGQGQGTSGGVCPSVCLSCRAGQGAGRPDIFSYAENNGFLAAIRIWEFRSPANIAHINITITQP